jgi:hypothetical protein
MIKRMKKEWATMNENERFSIFVISLFCNYFLIGIWFLISVLGHMGLLK